MNKSILLLAFLPILALGGCASDHTFTNLDTSGLEGSITSTKVHLKEIQVETKKAQSVAKTIESHGTTANSEESKQLVAQLEAQQQAFVEAQQSANQSASELETLQAQDQKKTEAANKDAASLKKLQEKTKRWPAILFFASIGAGVVFLLAELLTAAATTATALTGLWGAILNVVAKVFPFKYLAGIIAVVIYASGLWAFFKFFGWLI